MSVQPLVVANTGLVLSVGLSAPAACAAIRAGLTNPTATNFMDTAGEWIVGHAVNLEARWSGRAKLAHMAAQTIEECLVDVPRTEWDSIPLLLCVAERSRPGRTDGLEDQLPLEVRELVDASFAPASRVIPDGRASIGIGLIHARRLLGEMGFPSVLIVATDSLLRSSTLKAFEHKSRLLTSRNPNGFIPGEGAAALLLRPSAEQSWLQVLGVGLATEAAYIGSGQPLRADGLSQAIRVALREADCEMHDLDFRIADVSGEQYYFKEATLALSRVLKRRKHEFDIWLPAQSIGEVGSVVGPLMVAVANAASRKRYAAGSAILLHAASDSGQRVAIVAKCTGEPS